MLNVPRHRALDLIKSADRKVKLVVKKTQKSEVSSHKFSSGRVAVAISSFNFLFSSHSIKRKHCESIRGNALSQKTGGSVW